MTVAVREPLAENTNMDVMNLSLPAGKAEFNFEEAAAALGISSNDLENLVIERLDADGPAVRNLARMRFRPADLIMLNMVQAARATATAE
jgi:hypothetical protein